MPKTAVDLGVVGLRHLGAWQGDTTYMVNDLVTYNDEVWTPSHDGVINVPPEEGNDWFIFISNEPAKAAAGFAADASQSAYLARQSEEDAAASAQAAKTSQDAAATSASAAATSANTASTNAENAAKSASAATTSALNADASATAAKNSETEAAKSQSSASSFAYAANTAAQSAATSETNAAASAKEAKASQDAAAASAQAAKTSQDAAAGSAASAAADSKLVKDNLPAIQAIGDNLDAVKGAAENALLAESSAEDAATSAEMAKEAADRAQSIAQGQLGYYATVANLRAEHATGQNGEWAIVGETDTIWVWDSDTSSWSDSGNKTDLSQYYTKTQTDAEIDKLQQEIATSGKAATADKLTTARQLGVNLARTAASTFDGSANQLDIPVKGVLSVANGGTGNTTGTATYLNFNIIPPGSDLNTYKKPGNYVLEHSKDAASIINKPEAVIAAFGLFVFSTANSSSVLQILNEYPNGNYKVYIRGIGDGVVSGTWHRIYNTGDKPTAADVGALPATGKANTAGTADKVAQSLSFTGAETKTYNGSTAVTVNIPKARHWEVATTTSWTKNSDGSFQQNVNVSGMTASVILDPAIGYITSGTPALADKKKYTEALGCISEIVSNAGSVTFICYEKSPTVALTVLIQEVL